jgi:hypothetical protein
MDNFGELFRGIGELLGGISEMAGERAGEAMFDGEQGHGRDATATIDRYLVGAPRILNVNDR